MGVDSWLLSWLWDKVSKVNSGIGSHTPCFFFECSLRAVERQMFDIDSMCNDMFDVVFSLFFIIFSGVANPDPCLHGGNHPHLILLSCWSHLSSADHFCFTGVNILQPSIPPPPLCSVNLCCGYGAGTLPSTYLEYSFWILFLYYHFGSYFFMYFKRG
jgi:hypothetical protein